MKKLSLLFALATCLSSFVLMAQTSALPTAITTDPPEDKAAPAAMESVDIVSHGSSMHGIVYLAEGVGPHGTVILLHGFPGNEQNLDLGQAIRRAGWNVLYFHYRGAWGSQGDFSFSHAIEDTRTAIDWIRDPENAKKYRTDPGRIVLIGHSMGGFLASIGGTQDPKVMAVGMVAAWNIGLDGANVKDVPTRVKKVSEQIHPLAGCTAEGLVAEMKAHSQDWNYIGFVPQLKDRPVLVVSASDGLRAANESFADQMKKSGAKRITYQHIDTDHSFNDHRIALQAMVLEWLGGLH